MIDEEYEQNMYLEQMTKIQLLKNKIEQIQNNVVSAKYGIVNPNILTNHEITKYDIDFNTLKYLQLGTATFNNIYLIIGIKIPKTFIQAKIRKIVPIPNKSQNEIDAEIEEVFIYENKTMLFEENKHLRQLKPSLHCIIKNNCKLITNKELEILALDEKSIIVKNANNLLINNTCSKNQTFVNGNYLIQFNNCSIKINDYYFSNLFETIEGNIMNMKYANFKSFKEKLTLDQIDVENKENFKHISHLKFHNKVIYGCNILITTFVVIAIVTLITKHRYIKIKLNKRIQENSNLKGGVVTYMNNTVTGSKTDKFAEFLYEINQTTGNQ